MTNAPGVLRHRRRRLLITVLLAVLAVAVGFRSAAQAGRHDVMPKDAAMESSLGVRFTQAMVVADGGIVELRYTVLDAQKASEFQNDVHHPPVLRSEKRSGHPLYRTALMKQGHELRPGQTYYVLYLNNHNAVRRGETLEIAAGARTLAKVPVD
jgi:hypothetical protein